MYNDTNKIVSDEDKRVVQDLLNDWSGKIDVRGVWETEADGVVSTIDLKDPNIKFYSIYFIDNEGLSQCGADFRFLNDAKRMALVLETMFNIKHH